MDARLCVLSSLCVPTSIWQTIDGTFIGSLLALVLLVFDRLLVQGNGTSNTTESVAILVTEVGRKLAVACVLLTGDGSARDTTGPARICPIGRARRLRVLVNSILGAMRRLSCA
jgi:hypothetical protein